MANFNSSTTVNGNVTSGGHIAFSMAVPTTDIYTLQATLQLPNIVSGGAASGVIAVVKQNSSTIYTSAAGDKGLVTGISATAGDVISITLSSSVAQDQQNNAVQMTVCLYEGQSGALS